MRKKVVGILIVGLLIVTIFPAISTVSRPINANHQKRLPSQIEVQIKGGWGIHAFIKNIGTTDLDEVKVKIVLDGSFIFKDYKYREATICLKAGETEQHIFPVLGLGATNIKITVDTTTQTVSGKILGFIVLGVK